MSAFLSAPYLLTDQGFVFILHDPALEHVPTACHRALSDPAHSHGGLSFFIDPSESLYWLRFIDTLTVSVSLIKKTVDLWPDATLGQEALRRLLIDQLVPRIFAAQGALVLHAGSISVNGKAIALMGETGAGKSTLTASFHLKGFTLINDDAVVVSTINSEFFVSASHPSLRLLPDSLAKLFTDLPKSKPLSQFTTKRHIVIGDDKRHEQPDFPLAALFFIGKESSQKISLRQLKPAEAVMAVIASSFALNPTEPNFAIANLGRASALAAHVPAYELNYPRSYEALPEVHHAIFNKLQELQS